MRIVALALTVTAALVCAFNAGSFLVEARPAYAISPWHFVECYVWAAAFVVFGALLAAWAWVQTQ